MTVTQGVPTCRPHGQVRKYLNIVKDRRGNSLLHASDPAFTVLHLSSTRGQNQPV